jgi:hypothetical protein
MEHGGRRSTKPRISEKPVQAREVMTINQKTSDQGWQQLQTRIEVFLDQALRSDVESIEDRPRLLSQLLVMPSERHQNELQVRMPINDNFSQKEG